MDYVQYISIAQ